MNVVFNYSELGLTFIKLGVFYCPIDYTYMPYIVKVEFCLLSGNQ